jgi:hypothetical protein
LIFPVFNVWFDKLHHCVQTEKSFTIIFANFKKHPWCWFISNYTTQSDHEILIVIRGHLLSIISQFSSYLREVLQAVTETPPSRENNFIPNTEFNFLIVVCSYFPSLSYHSRILRVKMHRQQNRRPLAKKRFSMNRPTPTMSDLLTFSANFLPFLSYLRLFGSAAKDTPPIGENNLNEYPDPDFLFLVCWHLLPFSHYFRGICVWWIQELRIRPLAEKLFSVNSPTPTSY